MSKTNQTPTPKFKVGDHVWWQGWARFVATVTKVTTPPHKLLTTKKPVYTIYVHMRKSVFVDVYESSLTLINIDNQPKPLP